MFFAGFHAARYGRMCVWGLFVGVAFMGMEVWALVGLSDVELGGVFEVEGKVFRLGVTAEYN
jgi:hypothetical protein